MKSLPIPISASYIPPLSQLGQSCTPGQEDHLYPGVRGYAIHDPQTGFINVPLIIADSEGSGDVGRFLDALSPQCCIPCVTSQRLRGMLERRGWFPLETSEGVEIWYKSVMPEGGI